MQPPWPPRSPPAASRPLASRRRRRLSCARGGPRLRWAHSAWPAPPYTREGPAHGAGPRLGPVVSETDCAPAPAWRAGLPLAPPPPSEQPAPLVGLAWAGPGRPQSPTPPHPPRPPACPPPQPPPPPAGRFPQAYAEALSIAVNKDPKTGCTVVSESRAFAYARCGPTGAAAAAGSSTTQRILGACNINASSPPPAPPPERPPAPAAGGGGVFGWVGMTEGLRAAHPLRPLCSLRFFCGVARNDAPAAACAGHCRQRQPRFTTRCPRRGPQAPRQASPPNRG
jgi:hypothetical protein